MSMMVADGRRLNRLMSAGPTLGVIVTSVPDGIMSPFLLRTVRC